MQSFDIAVELLVVGMITVWLVLFLVVGVGHISKLFVNRFAPEEVVSSPTSKPGVLNNNKLTAITAAVNIASKGEAKVAKIERL